MLAALIEGMERGRRHRRRGRGRRAGAAARRRRPRRQPQRLQHVDRAVDHGAVLGRRRPAAHDAAPGPRQLGDRLGRRRGAARALRRASGRRWRSPSRRPAPTRPRSARPPCLDGDEYVLNGEKIYVTAGERADLVVVWATLDRSQGRAAIKSFVVERSNPGMKLIRARAQARHPRLRHRGVPARGLPRARRRTCSATPEIDVQGRLRAARCRRSTTRARSSPAMAVGVARAALEETRERSADAGVAVDYDRAAARAVRGRRRAARHGGRLRGRAAADAAGGVDGRQRQAQLAAGLDGQGQGRAHRRPTSPALRRAVRRRSATARPSCSRSGRATRRSSTSSRARSRSSC